MLGEGKVLCWGTSHFSVSSVPRPSLSLSTMGGAVQVGGEEEEGSSRLWVWGVLGPSWGCCPGMCFCYQCEKPGQKGASSPCGASGGGRAPWCREEFQGELPGRCCQLAQWAAGFSSDEDVLNLLRLEQVKDVPEGRHPAWGRGVPGMPGAQKPDGARGPGPLYCLGGKAWAPHSPRCKASVPGLDTA